MVKSLYVWFVKKSWVFHEITVGATCTKCATYKEQATEFFEEASAFNTEAAVFDLKKRILQGHVELDGVRKHPDLNSKCPNFIPFLEKHC
jgi:hypothetical protein